MTTLRDLPCWGRSIEIDGKTYRYISLAAEIQRNPEMARLPRVLRILAENTLRNAPEEIDAYTDWLASSGRSEREVRFWPTRVLTHDSTCVPAFVDFAAMRDAAASFGLDPAAINPKIPVNVVIDHSVTVDLAGTPDALRFNMEKEIERNRERYELVRWAGDKLDNVSVIPPGFGIAHQVNVEKLSQVVWTAPAADGRPDWLMPDTLVGSDSHTPMVNGLSVLGWGVGGIDMLMASLAKPLPMVLPSVIGIRLAGRLKPGVTAVDFAYTLVNELRRHDVVDQMLEFYGPGLENLSVPDRATVANMSPEYGATTGYFPIDRQTVEYLRMTGRRAHHVAVVESYAKAQGLWAHDDDVPSYTKVIDFDLSCVETTLAGPRNPAERVALGCVPVSVSMALDRLREGAAPVSEPGVQEPADGAILIAAITSCTTTANPGLMVGAGLLARKARLKGLSVPWWVKTSLSPGSRPTARYLKESGVQDDLDALGFNVTGFGCMTCIGNSGELSPRVMESLEARGFHGAAVLSGNRNFEGRVHPQVKMAYLAAPALVVAYALAGTVLRNLETEPIGIGKDGKPVFLADIWPTRLEIDQVLGSVFGPALFAAAESDNEQSLAPWNTVSNGVSRVQFQWAEMSNYLRRPPYMDGMSIQMPVPADILDARPLLVVGDRISTDHISPAGSIAPAGVAGAYLLSRGVSRADFNQFSTRRGNHEVMLRGAFSNAALENELLVGLGVKGGYALLQPEGALMPIYDAAMAYRERRVPLIVVGGKEYGTGSSRDWAAKATALLGVKAVLAESFERIHRNNLISLGVLPLEFCDGLGRLDLELKGTELLDILGLDGEPGPRARVTLAVRYADGSRREFPLVIRVDTASAMKSLWHGGLLQQTIREFAQDSRRMADVAESAGKNSFERGDQ